MNPNHRMWNPGEDAALIAAVERHMSTKRIARLLAREPQSVSSRINVLKVEGKLKRFSRRPSLFVEERNAKKPDDLLAALRLIAELLPDNTSVAIRRYEDRAVMDINPASN